MASAPSSADTGAIGPSAPRLIDGFTKEEWLQWISEQGGRDEHGRARFICVNKDD